MNASRLTCGHSGLVQLLILSQAPVVKELSVAMAVATIICLACYIKTAVSNVHAYAAVTCVASVQTSTLLYCKWAWTLHRPISQGQVIDIDASASQALYPAAVTRHTCRSSGMLNVLIERTQHVGWWVQVKQAVNDGYDLRGYHYWTLLDDYEFNYGYDLKFGLYAWDPKGTGPQRTERAGAKVVPSSLEGTSLTLPRPAVNNVPRAHDNSVTVSTW